MITLIQDCQPEGAQRQGGGERPAESSAEHQTLFEEDRRLLDVALSTGHTTQSAEANGHALGVSCLSVEGQALSKECCRLLIVSELLYEQAEIAGCVSDALPISQLAGQIHGLREQRSCPLKISSILCQPAGSNERLQPGRDGRVGAYMRASSSQRCPSLK